MAATRIFSSKRVVSGIVEAQKYLSNVLGHIVNKAIHAFGENGCVLEKKAADAIPYQAVVNRQAVRDSWSRANSSGTPQALCSCRVSLK